MRNEIIYIKQGTKLGYISCISGGVVNISYPKSKTKRGRVQGGGDICPTLTCTGENVATIEVYMKNGTKRYRIRKLTPRECGRLMGVNDEDISKIMTVNSNTQCYKQFGNSIVVPVLEAIFRNLNLKS